MMIFRKNDATLDFDLAKAVEQSKDNPVFYVQYGHARCASVFRQAAQAFPDLDVSPATLSQANLSTLDDESEIAILRLIAGYPRLIEAACGGP
jgi:arginyl-tRNA synthetase